jgi:sugar/nucleoside kinase (ribokinase family)
MRGQWPDPGEKSRPLFIWEPVPDLCTLEELDNCKVALKHVDIVSPNHSELGAFYGKAVDSEGHVDYRAIEDLSEQWIQWGIGPEGNGAVVVRAGKDGCYVRDRQIGKWIPAVHESADKVVDPTGGGNGFLGGFAVGLVRRGNVEEAAVWGSIAASFAIEQVGMPILVRTLDGETWNGVRIEQRLAEFRKRLDRYVQP